MTYIRLCVPAEHLQKDIFYADLLKGTRVYLCCMVLNIVALTQ